MSNLNSQAQEDRKHFKHVTGNGQGNKNKDAVWQESTEAEIEHLERQISQITKSKGDGNDSKYLTPQQKDVKSKISDIELL